MRARERYRRTCLVGGFVLVCILCVGVFSVIAKAYGAYPPVFLKFCEIDGLEEVKGANGCFAVFSWGYFGEGHESGYVRILWDGVVGKTLYECHDCGVQVAVWVSCSSWCLSKYRVTWLCIVA